MRAFSIVAFMLMATLARAAGASLTEWASAFEQPALGGSGVDIHDRHLVCGHLELVLTEGRLVPLRACQRVVGAFFTGSGRFRYAASDPILDATWRANVKHATDYEVGPDGAIGDGLRTALLLFSSGADTLGMNPQWTQGEPPAEVVAAFQRHLEHHAQDLGGRFGSLLAQAMAEMPKAPVGVIEIGAEKHDLVYVSDTLRDGDEVLACMHRRESQFETVRDPEILCLQPMGRQRLQSRLRRFRLLTLDVTLENPEGDSATLAIREVLQIDVPLRTLEFDLDNRMIAETGALGSRRVELYQVVAITDAEGHPLPFVHRHGELVVELPERMPAGSRMQLDFQLQGDVLLRPGNDNYWVLMTNWYPRPPRACMEAYTYHAICKVRKPFLAFSCGRTERRWEEGEQACAEFRESRPIQGAFVLAGKYFTHTVERDSLTVRVSTYAERDEDKMQQIAGLALAFIQFYVPLMGKFPFHELNILEINSFGFGVAPPSTIFLTREAFARVPIEGFAGLFVQGINRRLAHEVAHAWWGHVAELGEEEDQWLSESVAEYYSAFALGKMKGKDEFDSAFRDWVSWTKDSADRGTIYLANQIGGEDSGEQRFKLLYGKGPLMLHALRHQVGDETFFTILKSYLRSFPYKPATTRDFIGITNFITKQEEGPFFDQYLFRAGRIDVAK